MAKMIIKENGPNEMGRAIELMLIEKAEELRPVWDGSLEPYKAEDLKNLEITTRLEIAKWFAFISATLASGITLVYATRIAALKLNVRERVLWRVIDDTRNEATANQKQLAKT